MADRPAQEKTDIRSSAFIALVAIAAVGIGFGLIGARVRFDQELGQWQHRYSAETPASSVELPAQPRLEPLEPHSAKSSAAFVSRQREQEARLRGYGRTGEQRFVHVPIDKAIERLANDLKSKNPSSAPAPKSRGLVTGGEANSGRVFSEDAP
jgi:hypothetical protein